MGKYREAISCRPSEPRALNKTNFGAYFYRRRVRVYQTAALSSGAFKQENAPTGLFTYTIEFIFSLNTASSFSSRLILVSHSLSH
jgi:hypothetical protein